LKDKLSEFYSIVSSKLNLPEEAKQIMENQEVPLYKSVKDVQDKITHLKDMVEPYMPTIKYLPPPPDIRSEYQLPEYSRVLDDEKTKKIISYFPEGKQNFSFAIIYDSVIHGWKL
jgi:hypothetical protein